MSKKTELTPSEVRDHLLVYFKSAEKQITKGKRPTSICVEGLAGIGKTSVIGQIAKELGYRLHVENTAMIDDLGHLVGYPEKDYEFEFENASGSVVEKHTKWIPSSLAEDAMKRGGEFTGETRMSYAKPYWLKDLDPNEKFILFLDDYTRALPMVMQACMTITEEYRYKSWELPKNAIVILSTNPDSGEYSVATLDHAQKTRFRAIFMKFAVESWAQWAEKDGIDGRCINFVLHNQELFSTKGDGIGGGKDYNARIMTKFFEDIGNLEDFSKSLPYVKICGDGSVGPGFTDHFITFVANGLDKLPNPADLLAIKSEEALQKLTSVCGNYKVSGSYNPATAMLLATRIMNHVIYGDHEKWGRDENQKIIDMMLHTSFSEDIKFYMARQLMSEKAKQQSTKLQLIVIHPQIAAMIMKA